MRHLILTYTYAMALSSNSNSNSSSNMMEGLNYDNMSKVERGDLIREILPQCQPQEGSPPNTFTESQLADLKNAMPDFHVGPRGGDAKSDDGETAKEAAVHSLAQKAKHLDITDKAFFEPEGPQQGDILGTPTYSNPNEDSLNWHGAPRFHKEAHLAQDFRREVRAGRFTGPTNGVCPGFMQCNMVVLPQGQYAFDFLLFCQRNPKACPLVEVCDVGSPHPKGLAVGADLRTDVPKYAIYRDGKLEKEVSDVTDYWPENSVAFLIGCSFSYDGALLDAGIPLRSAEQGKNVPMYDTNLKCRPSGSLNGNMVVSMKPIPAMQISKHIEITSKYSHAHGGPVCVGSAEAIGVKDIANPEWGDGVSIRPDEVPVFHACGVTPQNILTQSKVPFAITHSAGHMFVTDLPSDMGV